MKSIFLILLFVLSIDLKAEIFVSSIKGNSFIFQGTNTPTKVTTMDRISSNDIIVTSNNGIVLIDFNDEVIGTVVVAPNSKVLLRKTNSHGVRLLSLIEGHLRFFKQKDQLKKRSGLLINIRENSTAYLGEHFEIQYTKELKSLTSFSGKLSKISLLKSQSRKKEQVLKIRNSTELTDQELEEDLKFLMTN
ncbi:FecR domain-containing protein [Halobacteriovorax sp. HLS]|uniref:FecR domain-containing protein n=1 Tax=Halobacteriovorax sp. HLS TaxID=2234000 RepID=UPI000FDA5DF4|nr:FecR domain-containing protein [Halobacteriovorax sp. HLS]